MHILRISTIKKSSWSKRNKLYHKIVSVSWFDFEALLRKYLFFLSTLYQISSNFLLIGMVGDWKWQGFYAMTFCWATTLIQHYKIPVIVPLLLLFSIYHLPLIEAIVEGMYNNARSYRFQCKMSKNTTHLTTILNHFICIWI